MGDHFGGLLRGILGVQTIAHVGYPNDAGVIRKPWT